MNRPVTQQPRYKHSGTKGRAPQGERTPSKNGDYSEGSNTEEELVSCDKCTEGSDDIMENHAGGKNPGWGSFNSFLEKQKAFGKTDKSDSSDFKGFKLNKITQKNLISPLPSFLKPPFYQRESNSQRCNLPTVMSSREEKPELKSKALENYNNENETICYHHYHQGRFDQKLCEQHKAHTESKLCSSNIMSKSYNNGNQNFKDSSIQSKITLDFENYSKISTDATAATTATESTRTFQKPKSSSAESRSFLKCLGCKTSDNTKHRKTRKMKPCDSEQEITVHDSFQTNSNEESTNDVGKVREKLVYVVEEEEGKNITKMETDLISVNEILAIKKDLLELSEFAKKLKKLKEMKKELHKGKKAGNTCHCVPPADLLKDVKKRIEALEARQEELERESRKSEKKEETETESKRREDRKTMSDSLSKTPIVAHKQRAMTSTTSLPKTEMIVSRAEGFSNNSEIVNELMDIKTQLLRLEKKRMSKESSPEVSPMGKSKMRKTKGHAIAVFSSRTYILTSDNYEKEKASRNVRKPRDSIELMHSRGGKDGGSDEINRKMKIQTEVKENVTNWLKTIPSVPKEGNNEIKLFTARERPYRMENDTGNSDQKCKKCAQTLDTESFENQARF